MIALAGGTGVGVNALLSRALGEKNEKKASEVAKQGVFLAIISYLVFYLVGVFGVAPFIYSQTDDQLIAAYGIEYLSIICIFSFGIFIQIMFERLLQSTGKTMYSMGTQLVGAIINLILDPILIFGLFGMPELGVTGAAVATVIGQVAAGITAIIFNMKKNNEIDLKGGRFKPSAKVIVQIYKIGVPSIIMQSIGSIMVYTMNQILMTFSSTATAVFGVYFKLQSFIFMPLFGFNNGMVPIIAYNYGAKNKDRLLETVKLSMKYAFIIMTFGFIIFNIIPDKLLMLFKASDEMMSMGVPALRIISIHFILATFPIIYGSLFQAVGNAVYSMITSICRQLVVLLPAAYLLSLLGEVNFVWWAFPIAEVASVTMTAIFKKITFKNVIDKIGA
jgi:putative MATE family efflux protein